jgi:hypothetical protein
MAMLLAAGYWLVQAERDPSAIVESALKAVGGREKLLKTFRLKDRVAVTSDPATEGRERASVVQAPAYWFLGKRNRVTEDKEPAVMLVWAWTLQALVDPAAKLEALAPARIEEKDVVGVRIKGTIEPPMDVWFDAKERLLTAIDWRKDRHHFSEWKEVDGVRYASRVIGRKADGKIWYHTRVTGVERLAELPADLPR